MRLPSLVMLATAVAVSPTQAQQQAPPQAWRVVVTQVLPSQIGAYRQNTTGLVKVAQAAKSARPWFTYTTQNRFLVARPVRRDSIMANPNAAIRQAQPDLFQKWMESTTPASVTEAEQLQNEVWVEIPDWTYTAPNAPSTVGGISITEFRGIPGQGAAMDSSRKAFVEFRKKIGYPYTVLALRVAIGEPRFLFVTLYDSREAFFGTNAMNQVVQRANAEAEWQALIPRLIGPMAAEWNSSLWDYAAALSYSPGN
jgi:hypothetical protein